MRTTIVTGATGFVGRRVCEILVERGEKVLALGRNFDNFPSLDERLCQRIPCSLDRLAAVAQRFVGVDAIIHSAAMSAPWGRRGEFMATNVEGTRALLSLARQTGVRRFLHVSSSSVAFDSNHARGLDEGAPLPAQYLSHYQESKAAAEGVVRQSAGVEWVILRPRGIFGPGDTALLPRIARLSAKKRLPIIGDGQNVQDLTYVDNFVDALLLARDSEHAVGRTYFITNDEPIVLWDLIAHLVRQIGHEAPRRRISFPAAFVAASLMESLCRACPYLGEPLFTRYTVSLLAHHQTLNISRAKRDLGYRPKVTMGTAVAQTLATLRGMT